MSEVIINQEAETSVVITASGNTAVNVGDVPSVSNPQIVEVSQAAYNGLVDGINTSFGTTQTFIANSLEVFYNGRRMLRGVDFTEKVARNGWDFLFTPEDGSTIIINLSILS